MDYENEHGLPNPENNYENKPSDPYTAPESVSAASDTANRNFSDDSQVVEKISVDQEIPPQVVPNEIRREIPQQTTYCAEHIPGSTVAGQSYSTEYYSMNNSGSAASPDADPHPQTVSSQPSGVFTAPHNVPPVRTTATVRPGAYYPPQQMSAPENKPGASYPLQQTAAPENKNVKKITNRRLTRVQKSVIAVLICFALVVGIASGSLAGRFIFRDSAQSSAGTAFSGDSEQNPSGKSPSASSSSDFLTYAIEDKDTSSLSTAEIAAKCGRSVVEIRTEIVTTGKWMQEYIKEGAGSGVVLTVDGYIVTNNHVIENANKIKVTLQDGNTYDAQLVGTDAKSDIALIRIKASGLTPASIGNSDKLVVGEKAIAIGNPLGELGGTVTDGIISALDREITIDGVKMTLLQTNAAINPGNSGGGLFNGAGNLIAIVDAKSAGEGIEGLGFAIPVNKMAEVAKQLMEYGYVKGYADTGMTFIDINDAITAMQYRVSQLGVYVLKVTGENAEKAGFEVGDLITGVNGKTISTAADIDTAISEHHVGESVTFEVVRGRQSMTLTLTLSEYVPDTSGV